MDISGTLGPRVSTVLDDSPGGGGRGGAVQGWIVACLVGPNGQTL